MKRCGLGGLTILLALCTAFSGTATVHTQPIPIRLGFVPARIDPYFATMQRGIEQAAADFGIEVVTRIPEKPDATAQIAAIRALQADPAIKVWLIAPVDPRQLTPMLAALDSAGTPVITLDNALAETAETNASPTATFPLTHIGTDNEAAGRAMCDALAAALNDKGTLYLQTAHSPDGIADQRERGCKSALAAYPDLQWIGGDDNQDDPITVSAQTTAILRRESTLAGIVALNSSGSQGVEIALVSSGRVGSIQVASFDAPPTAIDRLARGHLNLVVAQKPFDMGYTAVGYAAASLSGVTSLPRRVPTGVVVITRQNMTDPTITRFFYSADAGTPQPPLDDFRVAFVPGVVDPFYQNLERGINDAARLLKITVVTQFPQKFDPVVQTPVIQALTADKRTRALITSATDKQRMILVLEAVSKAGVPVISVDTFIGDGDYERGTVTFPLSYIGSDNEQGGHIACDALARAIGKKGKVYIQSVKPTISTNIQRETGCKDALAAYPGIEIVAVEYNDNDATKAQLQTERMLQREKDLAGIFGTNVFSAAGAGTAVVNAGLKGAVQVVAFDATRDAIEKLYDGIVTLVIAQKPYDMGFLAIFYAVADARGVTSIPKRIPTGFAVIDIDNVINPQVSRFIYR